MDSELGQRLEDLKKKHGDTVKIDKIAGVIEALSATMKNASGDGDGKLLTELEHLADYIDSARKEISALKPLEVKEEFLPTATDELDAIIEATAEATNNIMDATEAIEEVMENVDEKANLALMQATTSIYEACTFQDITGQRITKVVNTLKDIEEKIDGLLAAFGSGDEKGKTKPARKKTGKKAKRKSKKKNLADKDLLNGPQMAGEGKTQDEIDELLASFD